MKRRVSIRTPILSKWGILLFIKIIVIHTILLFIVWISRVINENKVSHLGCESYKKRTEIIIAFRAAFPYTVPIFAGVVFLGIAYGIYMNSLGFGAIYPILMSLTIFAGSMEFVAEGQK
jgi:hypothetical protein